VTLFDFSLNIGTAFLLGLTLGLERELRNHEAGLRTNTLVAVGAALFVSLSHLIYPTGDQSRIAAQVVSGIGFLAGGVIIRDGFSVRGMTTAATLWCTAAIGTLAGSGFPAHAAVGTVVVLVLHTFFRPLTNHLDAWARRISGPETNYRISYVVESSREVTARTDLVDHLRTSPGISIQGIKTEIASPQEYEVMVQLRTQDPRDSFIEQIAARLRAEYKVRIVSWEKMNNHSW
jgi:putative Mg2+ transporter-C (MgtC) family protein